MKHSQTVHNHCDFTNFRLFWISLTYPGSEIVCQVSSSEISTGLGRQFVAMLHFIQLNIFGDELGVLSRVSRLTNHRHDHFVRQLKRFVIICNTRNISIWLPYLKGFLKSFLPSFMTMMLRALVLSMATMAKSLKHNANEHSILSYFNLTKILCWKVKIWLDCFWSSHESLGSGLSQLKAIS